MRISILVQENPALNIGMEDFSKYGLSTPSLSLEGMFTPARLVDQYDGDTNTLIIPFKGEYFKFTCRMLGIDTCEMKSKIKENKENAIRARNRVLQLVGLPVDITAAYTRKKIQTMLDEQIVIVWVHCHGVDKYGRILGDIYTSSDSSEKSIAKMLIEEKLAYEYYGDTKLTEEQQADH